MAAQRESLGTVCTFYSYKGGVGRSMALANVAALLAKWGARVLIVDWDLEAPGIEKYFAGWLERSSDNPAGVLDVVESYSNGESIDWRSVIIAAKPEACEQIDILTAGKRIFSGIEDDSYVERLRRIKWDELFSKHKLGNFLERLRDEWRDQYDFVLVDSRTGITDIGGICTIHLPDVLVAFFTANEQSVDGVRDVLRRARESHGKLPVDRRRLLAVPVPSRDESGSEYELGREWRDRYAEALSEYLDEWVPVGEKAATVLDFLKIPYAAYWSFGERVPVLEEPDPENPKTLAFAYQPLARLLYSHLDWSQARAGGEATEAARQYEAERERAKLEAEQLEQRRVQMVEVRSKAEEYFASRVGVERELIGRSIDQMNRRFVQMVVLVAIAIMGSTASAVVHFANGGSVAELFAAASGMSMVFVGNALIVVVLVPSLLYLRDRSRARAAADAVMELDGLIAQFKVAFPGKDPEGELERLADQAESMIRRAKLGLEGQHEPYREFT